MTDQINKEPLSVTEMEDGSVLVPQEKEPESQVIIEEVAKEGGSVEAVSEVDEDTDDAQEPSEEERFAQERKRERHLKRDLNRAHKVTTSQRLKALERRNAELERRLDARMSALESSASSTRISQYDRDLEDQAVRIDQIKHAMKAARAEGSVEEEFKLMDLLTDEKVKFRELQVQRAQQIKANQEPRAQKPIDRRSQDLANDWCKRNRWFDPDLTDLDSKIARAIDEDLSREGFLESSDPEYWDELDRRVQERLPHRYQTQSNGNGRTRPSMTTSSRSEMPTPSRGQEGQYRLSAERVAAIKQAGAWNDPKERQRMIDGYRRWDRENANSRN